MQRRIPNSSGSEKGKVAVSCEHFINTLDSIKCREFCYYLKTCQLLKMPAGPWNWSVGQLARHPFPCHDSRRRPGPPHYSGFDIWLRRTTRGRIFLNELSASRRDVYLTMHEKETHSCPRRDSNFNPSKRGAANPPGHRYRRLPS